jgi:hypothetical protein
MNARARSQAAPSGESWPEGKPSAARTIDGRVAGLVAWAMATVEDAIEKRHMAARKGFIELNLLA